MTLPLPMPPLVGASLTLCNEWRSWLEDALAGLSLCVSEATSLGRPSSATSAIECMERRLARLRRPPLRKLSLKLLVLRKRSVGLSLPWRNSRDDFFTKVNCPLILFLPPELDDAMLGAADTRGPGSAVIVPNEVSSGVALDDAYEPLEGDRSGSTGGGGLNLGDLGDLGDLGEGGALAMRMVGKSAASSGCRNGVCGEEPSTDWYGPEFNLDPSSLGTGSGGGGSVCRKSGAGRSGSESIMRGKLSK